jgi:Kef-type K+ transport system membrane component KefB
VTGTTLTSLVFIALAAVVAPLLADLLRRARIPTVVLEIGLGIVIGPQVLGLAESSEVVESFGNLGLCFLMFLAGYEVDLEQVKGRPLSRAALGWLLSLVLAFAFAALLFLEGVTVNVLLIGLALTTTALGTLLPILRDAGAVETRFGTFVIAIGSVGEFAPIVAIALLLTGDNPGHTAVLLVVFIAMAVVAALVAARPTPPRLVRVLTDNLHTSAQLPVRVSVLAVVLLVWVASELGLDVLLGAFAAGIVVRLFSAGEYSHVVRVKLEAIGFGFLVPIFFVTSGMSFDLEALLDDHSTILRVPLFLVGFLVVRGIPALLLYRHDVERTERLPLALFSATALPLVVVITTIGLDTGRMLPANAAALVGAGMLSVLVYPLLGFALLRRAEARATSPDDPLLQPADDQPDARPDELPSPPA